MSTGSHLNICQGVLIKTKKLLAVIWLNEGCPINSSVVWTTEGETWNSSDEIKNSSGHRNMSGINQRLSICIAGIYNIERFSFTSELSWKPTLAEQDFGWNEPRRNTKTDTHSPEEQWFCYLRILHLLSISFFLRVLGCNSIADLSSKIVFWTHKFAVGTHW